MHDQLVAETATYRTQNKQKRRTSLPSAGFELAIPAFKRLQAYALQRRPPGPANWFLLLDYSAKILYESVTDPMRFTSPPPTRISSSLLSSTSCNREAPVCVIFYNLPPGNHPIAVLINIIIIIIITSRYLLLLITHILLCTLCSLRKYPPYIKAIFITSNTADRCNT